MFTSHPSFVQPGNLETPVWRYMSFTKFVSLLDTKKLYFARADRLDDPFEGSLAGLTFPPGRVLMRSTAEEAKLAEEQARARQEERTRLRKRICVSCWHMNAYESALMWSSYTRNNEGIAIRTTYQSLCASFTDARNVHVGAVAYIDHSSSSGPDYTSDDFQPFMHKRRSYEGEHEVRAVVMADDDVDFGLYVDVDMSQIIEEVYVAPTSPGWLLELVESMLHLYGYKKSVIKSSLDSPAYY